MTAEQREKIQTAIQALIEVEAVLHSESSKHLDEVKTKLSDARHALVDLNAPQYN
jgi:hypothetical protein